MYELQGVVVHSGMSAAIVVITTIASAKSLNEKWFSMNDDMVIVKFTGALCIFKIFNL